MNNYCVDLTFPCSPFKDDFNFDKLKIASHSKIEDQDLNPELVEFLDKLGFEIRLAECFYRKPYTGSRTHRDVKGSKSATKLNWVYGGRNSLMNWYEPISDIERTAVTDIGITYVYYLKEDIRLLHRQKIGFPSLLEVALPHDITMGDEERTCVSIILKYKNIDAYPTFAESTEVFKNYIND